MTGIATQGHNTHTHTLLQPSTRFVQSICTHAHKSNELHCTVIYDGGESSTSTLAGCGGFQRGRRESAALWPVDEKTFRTQVRTLAEEVC